MNKLFKALDDSTRRQIMELLKKHDMTAGEIADKFEISKPSISYHLDLLRQADLIISVKKGQYMYYSINITVIGDAVGWLLSFSNKKSEEKNNGQEIHQT